MGFLGSGLCFPEPEDREQEKEDPGGPRAWRSLSEVFLCLSALPDAFSLVPGSPLSRHFFQGVVFARLCAERERC